MKTLFIYNPNSGQKLIRIYLWDILNNLAKAEYDLKVYPTRKSGECLNYIKENGSKYDLVIVSGGDGTLNEAINGLMSLRKRPNLGYIPAGTTNDFGATHKIPRDMNKASKSIIEGKNIYKIDIGKFNDRYFDYVAAFGAFTDVAYNTPQDIKNRLGHLAYLVSGIEALKEIKPYKIHIKTEDIEIEDEFIYGMITNTYQVGGLYRFNKSHVKFDDGLFEVTLVKNVQDPLELAEMAASLAEENVKSEYVIRFKCKNISLISDKQLSWTLDGENGGRTDKAEIKVLNKAITLTK